MTIFRFDGDKSRGYYTNAIILNDINGIERIVRRGQGVDLSTEQVEYWRQWYFFSLPSDPIPMSPVADAVQRKSEKGQPNGYASLDGTGKVPTSQLPNTGADSTLTNRVTTIESELGSNPSGASDTVTARFGLLDSEIANRASIVTANTFTLKQTFQSSIRIGSSATAGYVLTTDALGNAAWSAIPAPSISDAATGVKGLARISVTPADPAIPIAVGTNDARVVADQDAATASIRTLGTGALQAAAGDHSHTGLTVQPAGTASVRALGTGATEAAAGNDPRLSDARTPVAHSHSVADISATGTRDGTTYLRGDGVWAVIPASTPPDASATTKGVTRLSVAPDVADTPVAVGTNDIRVTADQVAGTASIRSLGSGAQQAAPGNHTHTGFGTGDNVNIYGTNYTPQTLDIRRGTSAAPDTAVGPTVKVSRTMAMARTDLDAIGGTATDGGEPAAAIIGVNIGTTTNEIQTVGVYGGARNASSTSPPNYGGDDACGLYGAGRTSGSGTGIGAFVIGRRDNDAGAANGLEVHVANYGTTAATWAGTGWSASQAVWINASGNADSAAAINISNAFGRQFDVGIGFTSQTTNSLVGPVKRASILDASSSASSILIRGSHATSAITVGENAGAVRIGLENAIYSSALLEVYKNGSADPLVTFSGLNASDAITMQVRQGVGNLKLGIAGGPGQFFTGTAQGDSILGFTAAKSLHIGNYSTVAPLRISATSVRALGLETDVYVTVAAPTGVAATDTANIQAAINTVSTAGSGIVQLQRGTYALNSTLTISTHSVMLRGVAVGGFIFSGATINNGTVLRWNGAANATMLRVGALINATQALTGAGVENLSIDGNFNAGIGLRIETAVQCTFRNLYVRECSIACIDTGVVDPNFAGTLNYVYSCSFENIWTYCYTMTGTGLRLGGDQTAVGGDDTAFCSFKHMHIYYRNGHGIDVVDGDDNTFYNIGMSGAADGTGSGIELRGSDVKAGGGARANIFNFVWAGRGGVRARAGTAASSHDNIIYGYSRVDSAPAPIVETGASLHWQTPENGIVTFGGSRAVFDSISYSEQAAVRLTDDFLTGSASSAQIGALGWVLAGTSAFQMGEANHPGIIRLSTGATAGTYANMGARSNIGTIFAAEKFDMTFIVRLNTNDTDTTVRLGLASSYSGNPSANGMYVEKLAADTSWHAVTRFGSIETRTAIAAVGTGWAKFRIRRVNATTVAFSINGGTEITHNTTVPNTGGHTPFLAIGTAAAADKTIDFDFFEIALTGLVR